MNKLLLFSLLYLLLITTALFKASRKKTLYLWSPVVALDIVYLTSVLLPYLFSTIVVELDDVFYKIVYYSLLSQIVLHCLLRKFNFRKFEFELPASYLRTNNLRYVMILISLFILILIGMYTGVTIGFLSGKNVEDLRRTSEVGIGFIRDIPMLIVQICTFIFLLCSKNNEKRKLVFVGIIAIVLFISTGNKAPILNTAISYVMYLTIKYRGMRLREYVLYYFSVPLAAAFFNSIRQGGFSNLVHNIEVYLSYGTFVFQVNTVKIVNTIKETNAFLDGQEFLSGLYKIIPRFIWPDKPLSFDYLYKELIGYDFEGGGTPIALVYRFFTNFGDYFYVYYVIWLLITYYMYVMAYNKRGEIYKIFFMFFVLCNYTPNGLLSFAETFILLMLICKFFLNKKVYL